MPSWARKAEVLRGGLSVANQVVTIHCLGCPCHDLLFCFCLSLSGDNGTCELKISEGSRLGLGLCPQRTHAWVIKISIHHFYSSHNVFAWDIATNYSQCVIWLHRRHWANNHNNVLSLLQLPHPLLCLLIFWNCAWRLKAVERERCLGYIYSSFLKERQCFTAKTIASGFTMY